MQTETYEARVNKHAGGNFEFYDERLNVPGEGPTVLPILRNPDDPINLALQDYLLALALCHTVVPESKTVKGTDGEILESYTKYNAASPDDGALVKAAMNFGYELREREMAEHDTERVTLSVKSYDKTQDKMVSHDEVYTIHATVDANSDRKRMTVVVSGKFRGEDKIMVICKGADNVVRARCTADYVTADFTDYDPDKLTESRELEAWDQIFAKKPSPKEIQQDDEYIKRIQKSADKFADQGLRCMFVAQGELTQDQLTAFLAAYDKAKTNETTDKAKLMAAVESRVEYNFRPIGCTAIEDKLQLNVGRCLGRLAKSGIQTWVLTGDKVDTAINIGFASNLLRKADNKLIMEGKDKDTNAEHPISTLMKKLDEFEEEYNESVAHNQKVSLIIEGDALTMFGIGWADERWEKLEASGGDTEVSDLHQYQERLIRFAGKMDAVICCRVSPKQKGDMTKLVKELLEKVVLGIGDGANDVEMILQADVGVGVQGVEGSQAVNNSDFAITEFQHLENLLLVHGRWTYQRIATSVCYFFYKNIAFTLCVFWFACFSGFSGQLFFEAYSAASYNVFFTAAPVLVFGLMNQDLTQDIGRKCPKLYEPGQQHAYLNFKVFSWWISEALYASIIMFFFGYACLKNNVIADGRTYEHWAISTTVYSACVFAVTLRIVLETSSFNWVTHLAYWGSILAWFIYCFLTCGAGVLGLFGMIPGYSYQYWVIFQIMQSGTYYVYVALVPLVVTLPAYLYMAYSVLYKPSLADQCKNQKYWKDLVMKGLLDPDMAVLEPHEKEALARLEAGPVSTKEGQNQNKMLENVKHGSLDGQFDGEKVNQSDLWSGKTQLTAKQAIRRAARKALNEKIRSEKVQKRLGQKGERMISSAELLKQERNRLAESAAAAEAADEMMSP